MKNIAEVQEAIRVITRYFGHSPFELEWVTTMLAYSKLISEEDDPAVVDRKFR